MKSLGRKLLVLAVLAGLLSPVSAFAMGSGDKFVDAQTGEVLANRVSDIEKIFDEVRKEFPNFRAKIDIKMERQPFVGQGREPLLKALNGATQEVLGMPIQDIGWNAWTDAALLQSAGVPTVLIGPTGGNLHSPNEWVEIAEVVKTVEVLKATIVNFLS